MMLLLNVVDDIIEGVRHRWPAALASVAVLSGASRLTSAVLPGSLDAAWAETIAAAAGVTLGLAVADAITRLPERLAAPVKGGPGSGLRAAGHQRNDRPCRDG
ncbi:hypothetical protein [Streptomyces sp. NPDC005181]|uniref:hypothetical protein n=1 Tax=Streptomyces sp. NPDC005181 TaxID=3156869 RepID=UPI0033A541D1